MQILSLFHADRVKNFLICWALAFAVGISFRFLTNFFLPNDCLSTEIFQLDEAIRGPIVYAGLLVLDRLRKKFLVADENSRYYKYLRHLPKIVMFAVSVSFEILQNNFTIINSLLAYAQIFAMSCFLGSVEDVIMDGTTIILYKIL